MTSRRRRMDRTTSRVRFSVGHGRSATAIHWVRVVLWCALAMGPTSVFAADPDGEPVSYREQIRPIFQKRCAACHGGVKQAAGLSFLRQKTVFGEAESGATPVRPGDPDQSELLARITADEDERMPPASHGPALSAAEIGWIRQWIAEGAVWQDHWAHVPPTSSPAPAVRNGDWPRQEWDRFILQRLESAAMEPAPAADRRTWLRRVSFDLTGLPPQPREMAEFLGDASSTAFERVVDRLLASPQYGERWASIWLDMARYADTMGYERDPDRVVWPWRDWVVEAYNADLPYDQFLLRQLAGDLLPNATLSDRLATAFHRNTQTNTECGADDEEFRTLAVIDRVAATWEGLLGTSFRCTQCHDHPYDPFSNQDYYRFAALFNTTRDHDANEDFPHVFVPRDRSAWQRAEALDEQLRRLRGDLHATGIRLADETPWTTLRLASSSTNGPETLEVRESSGQPEVWVTGNVRVGSTSKLEFPLDLPRLTALRIDAIPLDPEKAVSLAELGFVLSHLQAEIVGPDGDVQSVRLAAAFDDDPEAYFPAEASLNDDRAGWSAFPRFNRPRRAVFVVEKPLAAAAGSRLRLTMDWKVESTGVTPQLIRRGRYSVTGDGAWIELVERQLEARSRLAMLQAERRAIESLPVPVLSEQSAGHRRETRMFRRGSFLDQGDVVQPGVPAYLGGASVQNRRELVQWMTSPDHPLTARVAVNRIWEQLFGRGIVETTEDFGSAGQAPTHPELLDWLAVRYARSLGWSQKRLLRELVLSATYRQSAVATAEKRGLDPRNRLLSRGPRTRLSAEMVRDQALAVGGMLSAKMGGPPVMPLQPEGVWRVVYNGGQWVTSAGEDAHRRAIYTFTRRTSGYPSFLAFDGPSRETCATRRIVTNTPLQALVTLNDPAFMEAAVGLAGRMQASANDPTLQIAHGFELATSQTPAPRSLTPLVALYDSARSRFAAAPERARELGDSLETAALAAVANAILNLDAALTK